MTSQVVVDSGVFLAAVLPETFTSQVRTLLRQWRGQSTVLFAPVLFRYEVIAVVRKHVHRGTLTPQRSERVRNYLMAYPIQFMIDDNLLNRAYELATHYNRPTAYDSQYLALAERLQCEFWTADERLFNTFRTFA